MRRAPSRSSAATKAMRSSSPAGLPTLTSGMLAAWIRSKSWCSGWAEAVTAPSTPLVRRNVSARFALSSSPARRSTMVWSRAASACPTSITRASKFGSSKKRAGGSSTTKATVPLRPVRSRRAVELAT